MDSFELIVASFLQIVDAFSLMQVLVMLMPFALFLELPLNILVFIGILKWSVKQTPSVVTLNGYPMVSCCITCYSEGLDVIGTIKSLRHQNYPGTIEIIPVIDGAIINKATLDAAKSCAFMFENVVNRTLMVLPKWQRGGRVSSLNTAFKFSSGEIVMALDGDTSFDNDMVLNAVRHFSDPAVMAVAGNLRVRNGAKSLATRLQGLEYLVSIGAGRTGLSSFNIVNNISGAFGIFRATTLQLVKGWDTGSAEDLDITTRIKQYFGRHKKMRIVFDPYVIGHTDVPDTFESFFGQRLRWEGDLFYLIGRKYLYNIRPSLLGWREFFFTLVGVVFFQMVMPVLVFVYMAYLLFTLPIAVLGAVLLFVYLFYLGVLVMLYGAYFLLISERQTEDSIYFLYLPIFPIFAFASRLNSAVALVYSMVNRSHLDSAMAPWWVLKRGKF
jgi:cellulose synthase/poly-beta-1,6-N-acetylglucosamine synthase-like glycosyltransferase